MSMHTKPADVLRFLENEDAADALLRVFERARQVEDPAGGRVLVMLVSRRLACLYEMLIASSQIERFDPERFEVVTDRLLDASPQDWSGRRAVLVDDVVNLGSRLVDCYDRLVDCVGSDESVTAMVAMRNVDRSNPHFVEHLGLARQADGGPLELDDETLQHVALGLVTCLYRSLMPYFTDFPISTPLRVSAAALDKLLRTERWLVADVTAPIGDGKQRAYSFTANEDIEDRIRRFAVSPAIELAELLKVRLFASAPDENGSRMMRFVPIGVPGPALPRFLGRVLEELADVLLAGTDTERPWENWTPRAQHRLLQMYISACVAEEFWTDLKACGIVEGDIDADRIEMTHLSSYFGVELFESVRTAFRSATKRYRQGEDAGVPAAKTPPMAVHSQIWKFGDLRHRAFLETELIREAKGDGPAAAPPRPGAADWARLDDHRLWLHRMLSFFGHVDEALEREQAGRLKRLTHDQYLEYKSGKDFVDIGPRYLNLGVHPRELSGMSVNVAVESDAWSDALVWLALDVGNDLGIAVPTTVEAGPYEPVCRLFRSGEGAFLANKPHSLLRSCSAEHLDERLDQLTVSALGFELTDEPSVAHAEAQQLQRSVESVISGERLLQKWIGEVREVDRDLGTFTADFVTVFVGQDVERFTFPMEETLTDADREIISEGSLVEWLVYGAERGDSERARHFRVTSPEASIA